LYAIKLILPNYSSFSIAKIVVNKIERVKSTLSRLPTNTELIIDKLVLIIRVIRQIKLVKYKKI